MEIIEGCIKYCVNFYFYLLNGRLVSLYFGRNLDHFLLLTHEMRNDFNL